MNSILVSLLAAMSQAALAVFAKLITKGMFEKLFERLILSGCQYLADKTDSPLLDQVAAIVKGQLEKDQ